MRIQLILGLMICRILRYLKNSDLFIFICWFIRFLNETKTSININKLKSKIIEIRIKITFNVVIFKTYRKAGEIRMQKYVI